MKKLLVESTGFPLTNDTLRFLNSSTLEVMTAMAQLCGDKTILSGVVETGGVLSPGFIAVDGEVLFFQGGAAFENVQILEMVSNVNYNTNPQDSSAVASFPAYAVKSAMCVSGTGTFAFSDLTRLKSLKSLSTNSLRVLKMFTVEVGQFPAAGFLEPIVFDEPVNEDYTLMAHWKSEFVPGEEFGFSSGIAWETRNETPAGFTLRARRLAAASTSPENSYKVVFTVIATNQ